MWRWISVGVVLTSAGVTGVTHAESEAVSLDIPARAQASESPKEGWCAETAIQEAMLHYGSYVPQFRINRAGEPRNPDLYWGDIGRALRQLGVRSTTWSGRGGHDAFVAWVRKQLRMGRPVIAGVKLYPTAQPRWGLDHIVLIVGVDADGSMRINTTWGYQLRRTAAQLRQTKKGMSLANRYGRQFAHAITGLSGAAGPRVSLALFGAKRGGVISARAQVSGLVPGEAYELLRDGAVIERFVAKRARRSVPLSIKARQSARLSVRASRR